MWFAGGIILLFVFRVQPKAGANRVECVFYLVVQVRRTRPFPLSLGSDEYATMCAVQQIGPRHYSRTMFESCWSSGKRLLRRAFSQEGTHVGLYDGRDNRDDKKSFG
jgi:hypothetical protein